jgi:PAS domain S-box-containing protein
VTAGAVQAAVASSALARSLVLEHDEAGLVARFLDAVMPLVGTRAIAVRVVDLRGREPARTYVRGGTLRDGVARDRLVLAEASLGRAQIKGAIAASARLRVDDRWDSPFVGAATGFVLPLAAAGELYGVFDLGYPPGAAATPADDASAIEPLAAQLAVALRANRLHGDTVELRDYQSRLIEHANALIVGIDRNWRVTVANRALLELTGLSRDEVLGQDLRDLLPADQRAPLTARFRSALDGEHQSALDIVLASRKQGRVRTVWTVAAVGGRDPADTARASPIEAVVAIGTDVQRLHDLEQQIIRAERLATLGKLAAGVVHELNNPLTSISVYADFLLGKLVTSLDEGDLEKLRRIAGSALRIQRFARELVQYARPPENVVEAVDVNDVVRQAMSICEHLFERSATTIAVDLDPALPVVQAVPGQLEQVVINLVTNAAHAVDTAAAGRIRIRTGRHGADWVVLEVADSGPGIPAAERERIFEPFYTTKPDGKGTGLGLPIVRNIVEQHRGQIAVGEAELGGASFEVRLPGTDL